jgi:hypothetical protein
VSQRPEVFARAGLSILRTGADRLLLRLVDASVACRRVEPLGVAALRALAIGMSLLSVLCLLH